MNAKDYLELPYTIVVKRVTDQSGTYYFVKVLELDGCMSDGETLEDAYANIHEAMEGWIETKLAAGYAVPLPFEGENYSGKFVVRLPRSLHAKLAMEAEREGVSLNQYTLYKLAN